MEKIINVLLAEDNDDDVEIVRNAFEQGKVINILNVVSNGEEVLTYLRKEGKYTQVETPGLILLDINMPKKNGFQVLEELKKDQQLKHIPIIMLTTSSREEDIIKSYREGACTYVTKPVSFKSFNKVIERFSIYWALVAKIPQGAE